MPDEFTNKAIEELAKQLPVKSAYDDVASPAAKEVGETLADVVKVLRLALAPVQMLGALQDRYKDFLDKSVRRIPEENRLSPPPQILGPVLEALRYEPEGTPLESLFSQLLSSSMDKEQVDHVHPAFVETIKQLSSDEATLLVALAERPRRWHYRQDLDEKMQRFLNAQTELDERPIDCLARPQSFDLYILHLFNLGLCAYYDWKPQEPEFEAIIPREPFLPAKQIGVKVFRELKLTDWGATFMKACLSST